MNHELGEKANYVYDKDGLPNLIGVTKVRTNALSESFYKAIEKNKKKKKKGKKLIKGFSKKNETIQEEDEDENSDSLVSDDISEGGDDNARILRIPKGGKKSLAKNYDTVLIIKIIEAIKSVFFIKNVFNDLGEKHKLILLKYNISPQDFLGLTLSDYRIFSKRYIIYL